MKQRHFLSAIAALSLSLAAEEAYSKSSENTDMAAQAEETRAGTQRVIDFKPVCEPVEIELEGVEVIPREKWGAKPAKLDRMRAMVNCANFPIKKVTVHHTGDNKKIDADDELKTLKAAQRWHMMMKLKWGDLAYHYAIGPSGKIYEGRNPAFRGSSSTEYYPKENRSHTPEGHLLITVIGNYELQELSKETRVSLANLIAANLHEYGLTPEDVDKHKDIADTVCPGDSISKWLDGPGKSAIIKAFDES